MHRPERDDRPVLSTGSGWRRGRRGQKPLKCRGQDGRCFSCESRTVDGRPGARRHAPGCVTRIGQTVLTDDRADVRASSGRRTSSTCRSSTCPRAGCSGWRRWSAGSTRPRASSRPTDLIPQAEVSGDIGPLTRWVLMEACEQACSWSPSIQLGVNCTIDQLRRGEVSKAVANALEQTGLRERAADPRGHRGRHRRLVGLGRPQGPSREMGVQLSVDDVGTNWSSFEPFKRHSISTVKIDGSFIAGLESDPGDQPAGGGDGDPHGPLARDVRHRRVGGDRGPGGDRPVVQCRRRPGVLLLPADVERGRRRLRRAAPEVPQFSRTEMPDPGACPAGPESRRPVAIRRRPATRPRCPRHDAEPTEAGAVDTDSRDPEARCRQTLGSVRTSPTDPDGDAGDSTTRPSSIARTRPVDQPGDEIAVGARRSAGRATPGCCLHPVVGDRRRAGGPDSDDRVP